MALLVPDVTMKVKVKVRLLSRVRLFATPWMVAYQAPRPMGFSRQEYWSGLQFPSPGDLPNPRMEPMSPTLQAGSLPAEPQALGNTYCSLLPLVGAQKAYSLIN